MEVHKEFTEWAVSRGVKINGIAAHRFPGRGISIIAKKSFEAGETLLSVPTTALRTVHTVPKTISRAIGKITVNGLLSAELALDTSEHRAPWRVVLPTREDFLESVPLMWDSSLQALLPDACQKLLSNQKRKVALDWAAVSKTYSKLSYDLYLYNWLLVNTRTFYFLDAKAKKQPPRDDCSALSPFADYFNHAPHGCNVSFSATGYEITTEKHIPKGAEIYISYGNHSNDFLLAEYGFILPSGTNDWDEISLDAYIIPLFSPTQKKHLEDHGFLGKYVLDKETVCYRAQVALRILCVGLRKWERFVEGYGVASDGEFGESRDADGNAEGHNSEEVGADWRVIAKCG
ncbi:hypothetical protein G7Y89_g7550 [Cudoniella acicularis]|uniref:SET domain-containing protein n=1 Tax=Cudoniella acicularis TaxID=354080 RepID=A0A8H4W1Y4_9HELO|nr:hypothetical protein G7Y89_g7550 [Cudoniella acicularis]